LANHKSARKRARQSVKRRDRNRHVRSGVRSAVKRARAAVSAGDAEQVPGALRGAESALRRAASKGVIPRKRASRLVSRLARSAR
jgi:small subunit ribosomal protein S20